MQDKGKTPELQAEKDGDDWGAGAVARSKDLGENGEAIGCSCTDEVETCKYVENVFVTSTLTPSALLDCTNALRPSM